MSSSSRFIAVLLVEDHDMFRTGLAAYLASQPDIEVVGQSRGGHPAVRLAAEIEPDVVLMALRIDDPDGTDAIRVIAGRRRETRVVVLTTAADELTITGALAAGARGFVVKDSPIDDVAAAVRAVAGGAAWLAEPAADLVQRRLGRLHIGDGTRSNGLEDLSARELDVLRLLARGLENAQIADELDISPSTAKNHVSSILAKLGLPNRIQAALYAVRNELP